MHPHNFLAGVGLLILTQISTTRAQEETPQRTPSKTLQENFSAAIQEAKIQYLLSLQHQSAEIEKIGPFLIFENSQIRSWAEIERKVGQRILSLGTYGDTHGNFSSPPEWENPLKTFPTEAETLIQEGNRSSIQTLIEKLGTLPLSRETMDAISALYNFPNREIAEWISESIERFPKDDALRDHLNMLCMVAGHHITPTGIQIVRENARKQKTHADKILQWQILSATTNPDTLPALMEIVQTHLIHKNGSKSIGYYAAKGIAEQRNPDGLKFLQEKSQEPGDPMNQGLLLNLLPNP
jgi:hypothetical protein